MTAKRNAGTGKTLTDFIQDAKRAKCKVCKLSAEIRAQIRTGREASITTPTIAAWLKAEHGVDLATSDFLKHSNARHDT